jgi:acyl-CoA synthetase (AMP-forming)/AMP-acid ligase II/acetyltransferase-like isoleucine patch superfamily enzyme/acyl carrier protein
LPARIEIGLGIVNNTETLQIVTTAADSAEMRAAPPAPTVHQLLELRSRVTPEALALMAPGRQPLTYASLYRHLILTAGRLGAAGIARGDRVAVVVPNGPEMAAAFVSVAAVATCAPLNPAYRAPEFEFYLSDLKAKALIIDRGLASPAREVARQLDIPVLELAATRNDAAGEFELDVKSAAGGGAPELAHSSDTALVLHTSGTTSRPKIVPLSHSNVCHSGRNVAATLALTENDRCLNVMPLFHIHGLIAGLLAPLTSAGSVICSPGFDAEQFFQWMESLRPTWYTAVPTIHQAVLSRASANRDIIARRPLRLIRSSSAALPPIVLAQLEETFHAPVIEAYGMTEAAHQMASNPLPPLPRKPGSVGLAAGPDIAIMDGSGNLLPVGAIGEVVIRGRNVTGGYDNNPAANESSFTGGWFRTGDQGCLDPDGYLRLTGRLKELINRGGEKIAPKEVDEILLQHPAVAQAVAFAVPHPTLGEDVAAAVVLRSGASAQEQELVQFAAKQLADFKVPKQLLIVNDIPKGPTGKLQRIGLAQLLASQLAARRQANFVAAEDAVQLGISEVWKSILKIGDIGVRDSFFELGGDSLALVTMLLEIERKFAVSVPVDLFLNSPTVETIAELVKAPARDDSGSATASQALSAAPPIRDSALKGLKNRLLQYLALYAPGFKTTRVWLHRMRGVSIGTNVSIGLSALIETAYPELVRIGDNVTIGMRAIIIGHLRDSTTHSRQTRRHTVNIERDVYIGPGVIILPNVTIGAGAVVSAGSVVSRSVPPKTFVRGNPAVPVAHCGVSLAGGTPYEEFVRNLKPLSSSGDL